ncbi:C-Maf-inducing protein-like [Pollicipes pollicipes]|uniref:C-Maf-inducing protein-like n=1 Tax=Pollicipes pollicipes TaxID=41117 RepID=UPI0018858336|nr:C-Maf-inducing protein-like [Pollicipes pollicipes]
MAAACALKRRLDQKDHHRSVELISDKTAAALEVPVQKRQTSFDSNYAAAIRADPGGPHACRAKVRLVLDGCVQVCRVVHGRTLISKLLNTKYLCRWESHHLYVTDDGVQSRTRQGFMDTPVTYSEIREVRRMGLWEAAHKFCLSLVLPTGLLVLQMSSPVARDQWYHSISWKKRMFRHKTKLNECRKPEALVREIKAMIDVCMQEPLLDDAIYQTPLDVVSGLLTKHHLWTDRLLREELMLALTPLLERLQPSREVCEFFSRFCRDYPRSILVQLRVAPVVEKILKHNVDFSKFLHTRRLVQDLLLALGSQGSGYQATKDLICRMHGPGSTCPHPRVLPNLVAACLGAVFLLQEAWRRPADDQNALGLATDQTKAHEHLDLFLNVVGFVSECDDWRPGLALLLQPIPFPETAVSHPAFVRSLAPVLKRIGSDPRCEVHKMVLATREEKDGWLDVVCPSSASCPDDGQLWAGMLSTLLTCCCRRKAFLKSLLKVLGACQLMALRGDTTCQEILCQMLEWGLIADCQDQRVTVSTLVSTASGEARYRALCDRMNQLRELQSKGGPRVLSLPSRSTDHDLAQLLSTGCFGNLEALSLAFTSITSQSAEQLIKLPNLRCLNLWCTQFGDDGLLLITEHLPKLEVLNLCETYVTNKSLPSLAALKGLHTLNLNSTKLSAETWTALRIQLPELREVDVRYTDAW